MATNRYQYETSPRKYQPDYIPSRPKKAKEPTKKQKQKDKKIKEAERIKAQRKKNARMIKYLIVAFGIIFAICYRNAKIDEEFAEIKELKSKLADIEKENTQLEVVIESETNLINLEQEAKELLGMQRLTSKQTIYADLQKTDYIESAAENVVINEETTWDKIVNTLKSLFK